MCRRLGYNNTSDTDRAAVRKIQQMIADKMELPDAVIGRQFQWIDPVDFVVDETNTTDTRHVDKDSRPDDTQIAFLDAQ